MTFKLCFHALFLKCYLCATYNPNCIFGFIWKWRNASMQRHRKILRQKINLRQNISSQSQKLKNYKSFPLRAFLVWLFNVTNLAIISPCLTLLPLFILCHCYPLPPEAVSRVIKLLNNATRSKNILLRSKESLQMVDISMNF